MKSVPSSQNQSKLRKEYQKKDGESGERELIKRKKSELSDSERVLALQRGLYQKAKQEKGYKFYVLYDKVFLGYILRESWKQVKANGGSSGIDGVRI